MSISMILFQQKGWPVNGRLVPDSCRVETDDETGKREAEQRRS